MENVQNYEGRHTPETPEVKVDVVVTAPEGVEVKVEPTVEVEYTQDEFAVEPKLN